MLAFATLVLLCQVPDPAPTVLVELGRELAVTEADYRAYLREAIGSSRLEDLIYDRILARECEALEPAGMPSALRAVLRDPAAEARAVDEQIQQQFGREVEGFARYLRTIGRTAAEERAIRGRQVRHDWSVHALVAARRRVDDDAKTRAFQEHFGPDGIAVVAEHVWVPFHEDHGHAGGHEPTAKERATATRAVLALATRERASTSLEAIGGSSLREGFEQMFGDDFAAKVRALERGSTSGAIASRRGMHVVRVIDKVVTPRERVEPRLADLVRSAPPSLAEARALREELLAKHGVPAALDRHFAR